MWRATNNQIWPNLIEQLKQKVTARRRIVANSERSKVVAEIISVVPAAYCDSCNYITVSKRRDKIDRRSLIAVGFNTAVLKPSIRLSKIAVLKEQYIQRYAPR
jgi:hypothetical protein